MFNLSESFLSVEEMAFLIEEKKNRRNLNIFVLSTGDSKDEESELSIFFFLLEKNISSELIPSRFQLAVQFPGHWLAIDCFIKNSCLYLFILDAAVLLNLPPIIPKSFSIKTQIFAYNGMKIQTDFSNCAFFTLNHVFRLSNRDKHWQDLLANNKNNSDTTIFFDEKNCPASLAFIFKPSQDLYRFQNLPSYLKKEIINKRNQSLEQAVAENTKPNKYNNKKLNKVILYKAKRYKQRGLSFFTNNQTALEEKTDRTGFKAIGGELGNLVMQLMQPNLQFNNLLNFNRKIFSENADKIIKTILAYTNGELLFFLEKEGMLTIKEITFDTLLLALAHQNLLISCFYFNQIKDKLSALELLILLDKAIKNKNNSLTELLLIFGVNPNLESKELDIKLPLITAIEYGNEEAISLLIKHKANLDQNGKNGKMTPRRFARCMLFEINDPPQKPTTYTYIHNKP
ncbi:MAG: ankyrin repeat domain-containing protein [Pseudomonadota bacterium]